MRSVRSGAAGIALAQAGLLGVLAATGLIGPLAAAVAVGFGLLCDVLVLRAVTRIGPADLVTWLRCALAGGVLALVVQDGSPAALAGITAVALLLDGVDGRVARATRTASAFGARFDMEVDAALVLILSIGAARIVGPWVLLLGAARYLLLVATALVPRLAEPTPPRLWRKVVAVLQGVVLGLVCARVLPEAGSVAIAIGAGLALAWSFGTQVAALLGRPAALTVRRA